MFSFTINLIELCNQENCARVGCIPVSYASLWNGRLVGHKPSLEV
jgi:hypothetical protein